MQGFSLIECLIYIALCTILIVGSHAGTVAISTSAERIHLESILFYEGVLVLRHIERVITENEVVQIGVDGSVILRLKDGEMAQLYVDDHVLEYNVGSDSFLFSFAPVSVEDCVISKISADETIRYPIVLTLTARTRTGTVITRTFETDIYP